MPVHDVHADSVGPKKKKNNENRYRYTTVRAIIRYYHWVIMEIAHKFTIVVRSERRQRYVMHTRVVHWRRAGKW